MADDTVKQALDGVVGAIGLGIVSDYRELVDSLVGLSNDIRVNTGLLDQINRNASDTNTTLDRFQTEMSRQREARRFRQTEDRLEGRVRLNGERSEQSLRKIAKALEDLQRQIRLGNTSSFEDSTGGDAGGGGGLVNDAASAGGSFLGGAVKAVVGAGAMLLGAAAIGGAGAYLMSGSAQASEPEGPSNISQGAAVAPATPAATVNQTPSIASDLSRTGSGTGAALLQTTAAAQSLRLIPETMRQKAIAKIATKVPSWLAKFGGRLTQTIGLKSIPVFGVLIGGYFSFSRFMSGDSWYAIGAEFVSGVAPNVGAVGGLPGWAAGVTTTLAIQTYLIARDIYQEENAIDIKNGLVPNFDDLTASEKAQVLKAVKVYIEAYVNNLISRGSQAEDAVTGVTPSGSSGAAPGASPESSGTSLAGAAAAASAAGAGLAPTDTATGTMQDVGQDINRQRQNAPQSTIPDNQGSNTQTPDAMSNFTNRTNTGPANESNDNEQSGASPSDNIASIDTGSDQTSMYSGGLEPPVVEIVEAGRGYNVVKLADGSVVKKTGDRNWRNNNPGNMEYGKRAREYGAIGSDGRFAIFPTMQMGDAARERLIFESGVYDGMSIEQAILKYAPPEENPNVGAYIATVAKSAGVTKDTQFGSLDAAQRAAALEAMKRVEGFRPGKVIQLQPPATPMAEGAKITPLASDKPKAGSGMALELRPPKTSEDGAMDEEKLTSSQRTIDARKKEISQGSPKEKMKNSISHYMGAMSYLFGTMTEELSAHINGEVTADKAFKDAMNPLS